MSKPLNDAAIFMDTDSRVTRLEVIDHRAEDEFRGKRGRVFTARPWK